MHRESGSLLRPSACAWELRRKQRRAKLGWGGWQAMGSGRRAGQKVRGLVTHWNRMSFFFAFPCGFSVRVGRSDRVRGRRQMHNDSHGGGPQGLSMFSLQCPSNPPLLLSSPPCPVPAQTSVLSPVPPKPPPSLSTSTPAPFCSISTLILYRN